MDEERLPLAIQDVLDRREILDCIQRFARGIDRLDRDLMLSAFHPDAVTDYGSILLAAHGFVEWALPFHDAGYVSTSHLIANHLAEIDRDTAHAETYVVLVGDRRDAELPFSLVGARYIDRFERRNGRWAISTRVCAISFRSELPQPGRGENGLVPAAVGRTVARDRSDLSYSGH